MTYAELQADLIQWMGNRTDASSIVPKCIKYATATLNRELDRAPVPEMESRDTSTLNSEYTALPSDFLRMRAVKDADGNEIKYITPQQFAQLYALNRDLSPAVYTLEDMQIRVYPAPSVSAPLTLTILYYERLAPLSASGDTNWLLTEYPDLYLYCSLYHARAWLHDDERMVVVKQMYEDALADLKGRVLTTPGLPLALGTDIPPSTAVFDITRGF